MNSDKPWVLIFNWIDPLGKVFITEEEHRKILKAIEQKYEQLVLDGQVIPLGKNTMVRRNPDYIDQERVERLRVEIEKQKEAVKKKYG